MTERPKVHNFGQYCALLGDLEQTVIIFLCIVNFQEPQLGSHKILNHRCMQGIQRTRRKYCHIKLTSLNNLNNFL